MSKDVRMAYDVEPAKKESKFISEVCYYLQSLDHSHMDKMEVLRHILITAVEYGFVDLDYLKIFKEHYTQKDYGELIGWVYAGNNRRAVLKDITLYKYTTPKQIADRTKIVINHVSNNLKELEEKGLIHCINPNAKRGRTYTLTDLGKTLTRVMRL